MSLKHFVHFILRRSLLISNLLNCTKKAEEPDKELVLVGQGIPGQWFLYYSFGYNLFFFSLAAADPARYQSCSQIQEFKVWFNMYIPSQLDTFNRILMQAAIAWARQKPIKQSARWTGTMRTCLLVYWAILIMIGELQDWYGSLPVCVFAANFVTAKRSAINDTSIPDRTVKTIHSPR